MDLHQALNMVVPVAVLRRSLQDRLQEDLVNPT